MTQLSEWIAKFGDVLLVMVGFGLIVFIHELGHFVAAKWAGIRVLAFALGFGPAIVSWRKGLGLRRGSSEGEYLARVKAETTGMSPRDPDAISPTEYRLNWLPLGGYVKMLGQDDLDPTAVSTASDSYQNCRVWKRMVVICAGVVMNVIAAAVLFICVFMRGLETEPAKIGYVDPGKPASHARALDGGVPPGLRAGDTVLSVNGRRAQSFNDLMMASAMSGRGEAMRIVVQRQGLATPVAFEVTPETSDQTRLMEIGVTPAFSAVLPEVRTEAERADFKRHVTSLGLAELEPGMRMVRVGTNTDIRGSADLIEAVRASGGAPVEAEFVGEGPKRVTVRIVPRAQLQTGIIKIGSESIAVSHLLGLMPLMQVEGGSGQEPQQGLEKGDILARIGAIEFPNIAEGMAEIHRFKGKTVQVDVLRQTAGGVARVSIAPDPTVKSEGDGRIGFLRGDTADENTLVALPPAGIIDPSKGTEPGRTSAAAVITRPGTRIVSVDGKPVANFTELRNELRAATALASTRKDGTARVRLLLELPTMASGASRSTEQVEWNLSASDVAELHGLGWESPLGLGDFQPEEFILQAQGGSLLARAGDAVGMGLRETQRVMVMTYATFARLFEGTVKIEHLKGPVGIAHMGSKIADRGLIWLLFFMALISVNLAVVNFLPLPIVDGGQFVFLILEGIRGKPVSIQVQNIATIAGLVLIGTMFLIVTFHDVANLFG